MSRLTIMMISAALVLMWTSFAYAKAGFINPQRIVNESKIGKIAQEDLARLGRIKDQAIRKSSQKISSLQDELDKGLLSVSQQSSREDEIKAIKAHHELLIEKSNRDIREEENRLIQFIMRKADHILRALAKQDGFTLILTDPESIGYIAPEVDLTDRVIQALNREM